MEISSVCTSPLLPLTMMLFTQTGALAVYQPSSPLLMVLPGHVGIPGKDTTNHNGLDIAYPYGTPILAVEAGTVIKAGYHVSYGNYLVINHGGGYCTLYAHCSQLLAQVGDTVNKYDTIAKVGATGDVTGNHLHICVIIDGVYVNPKGYLH